MARAIWAFAAFNIYSLSLSSAFLQNTSYLFDAQLISQMRDAGEAFDPGDWGWKDHYIWRLLAAAVTTAIAGFLAGAIARQNGGKVAIIANIPSVLVWIATLCLLTLGKVEIEQRIGFVVVSLIAIPLTTWIAYRAGQSGSETQQSDFSAETVLGIKRGHWVWLVFPLYLYAMGMIFVVAKFFLLQFLTWRDMSIIGSVVSLLALLPIIAWAMPLKFTYAVLAGEALAGRSRWVQALANAGFLIGGVPIAIAVQIVCLWLVQRITSWWY